MALTSRITLTGPPSNDPEDFLSTSLGVIFPDDVTNQHGDADHDLYYTSPHLPKPLHIRLAHPDVEEDRRLFSHYLWNASLLLAEFVEAGTLNVNLGDDDAESTEVALPPPVSHFDITGLSTIELGAGTALPSLLSALLGARRVVVTDYPAPSVMETLRLNVTTIIQPGFSPLGSVSAEGITVEGHSWGDTSSPFALANKHAFDRVIAADCLWMPWQHANLHQSIAWFLADTPTARAWVVAGFHTGREKMRGFFDAEALKEVGLEVEFIKERECDGKERPWVWDRGAEDIGTRKRWLVVAVLRRA